MHYSEPSIPPDEDVDEGTRRYFEDPSTRHHPYDFLGRVRAECPVGRTGAGHWMASDHESARAVLGDPRFSRERATDLTLHQFFDEGIGTEVFRSGITTVEGEAHLRRRRLVNRTFTPGAVARWRPMVLETAHALVDAVVDHGSAEFVSEIAYPLPERVICHLMGVPFEDHERFKEWSAIVTDRALSGQATAESRAEATAALEAFVGYLFELADRDRHRLSDDLVAGLLRLEDDGETLDRAEVVSIARELITGGHETTASLATNGLILLTAHRDQWDRLRAEPELIPDAVEEVLRYFSSIQLSLVRTTTEPVELGGALIPEGEVVFANLAAAGRDGAVFAEADRFDVGRVDNRHLGFGFGPHYCLGASLARLELQVLLEVLTQRLPSLRLVDEPLAWRDHGMVNTVSRLPVEW